VRSVAPAAESKRLRITTELPEAPLVALCDAGAVRQVLDNLLDNAVKYTPEGGRLAVRARADEGEAVIEVEDSGIGIEPRDQQRIFERFYRVDKARSRELGGTGLGLSIVKHIVLAHDGEVSVESLPGRGSTFRVRLPLAG
jgi:two-component system phosphate regulon sensor histidine kinase PhoR